MKKLLLISIIVMMCGCQDETINVPGDYYVPCEIRTYGADKWYVDGMMISGCDTVLPLFFGDTLHVVTDGYRSMVFLGDVLYLDSNLFNFTIPLSDESIAINR